MGDWDGVFDETYLQTYLPSVDPERTRAEALGAAELAGVEPGAEILDCPTGFGRHALVLAEEGYRVTGLDRSATLLAEAESRRGAAEWPRLVRGDYRSSRSRMRASTQSSTSSRRSATSSATRTSACSESSGGCFGPAARSSWRQRIETASHASHSRSRDVRGTGSRTALSTSRSARPDWSTGTIDTYRVIISPEGERIERPYLLHVYSVKEWTEMLRGGRLRRHRGVRRLGRSHACHPRRLATDPSRPR